MLATIDLQHLKGIEDHRAQKITSLDLQKPCVYHFRLPSTTYWLEGEPLEELDVMYKRIQGKK